MKSQIHHIAINTDNIDWYTAFFQTVFDMTIRKTTGSAPDRKVWFSEGIQLNECKNHLQQGMLYDHVAIEVDNIPECIGKALEMGCECLPNGTHWIQLPNGIRIELF